MDGVYDGSAGRAVGRGAPGLAPGLVRRVAVGGPGPCTPHEPRRRTVRLRGPSMYNRPYKRTSRACRDR